MKLGIIVGHTRRDEGAFSRTLNQQEYSWNSVSANFLPLFGGMLPQSPI
jgi:hypothetical protein